MDWFNNFFHLLFCIVIGDVFLLVILAMISIIYHVSEYYQAEADYRQTLRHYEEQRKKMMEEFERQKKENEKIFKD